MPGTTKSYRPDIDGLRAIAVLGVLLYHIDEGLLGGGFVGVDVFFVISGFLITSIIIKDLEAGKFSIARFYERRIRRIFPALFCVIAVCSAAAWFLLLPNDLADYAKSVKYVAISLSNLYFLNEIQDYFSPTVSQLPMLHTWSLGVEEQFYIVFPLLLMGLYRFVGKPNVRFVVIAVLFVISLGASCAAVPRHPEEAFFLLPYRAWEMMLGSLLAVAKPRIESARWNHIGGITGLAMILTAMVIYTEETPFPGVAALLPCVGSGLLIVTGWDRRALATRLLSWKALVIVGLMSYSVYLWHWPLLAFVRYSGRVDAVAAVLVFTGSLAVGALSWRFIEGPFRRPGFGTRRMVFGTWAVASILLLGFWEATKRTNGFPNRYSADVRRVLESKEWATAYRNQAAKHFRPEESPVYGAPGVAPDIALWGDSHARALLPVLDAMAKQHGRAIKHFGINAVRPIVGTTPLDVKQPAKVSEYTARTLRFLISDPSIKTVVLHARWSSPIEIHHGLKAKLSLAFHERSFADRGELESYYAARIQETVASLLAAGKKVVLIDPMPAPEFNVPDHFAKLLASGTQPPPSIPCADFAGRHRFIMEVFDRLGPSDRLVRIKPHEKLITAGRLALWENRQPLFADQDHLSTAGAFYLEGLLGGVFTP